jgi:multidrug efflux system membrane fusion protein
MSHPPQAPSRRRWIVYGLTVIILAAGVWYFSARQKPGNPWGPNPAWAGTTHVQPVRVAKAERRDLAVHLKAIGTVTPLNTVTVRSRVDGQLLRVLFDEGQRVTQGQLLAEIDPETYRIALAQAEARQSQSQAQLETARADLERFQQLYGKSLVTSQQMEAQQALVRQREGALAADQAAVDEARLKLAYTRIEAPIPGRLGLRRVDVGNLIRANDTNGLVVITQTQPITMMFTIPENELSQVLEPVRAGEQLVTEAWDRNEQKLLARGRLTTVDNQIDLATGTVRLRAEFANEDESLFPNQFLNVRLRVRTLRDAVVIPSAAVQFGSRGTYVFVVNEQSQVVVRDIVLGAAEGSDQAVVSGLVPGDAVVLEGVDRLREGRPVVVVEPDGVLPAGYTPPEPPAKKGKKKE